MVRIASAMLPKPRERDIVSLVETMVHSAHDNSRCIHKTYAWPCSTFVFSVRSLKLESMGMKVSRLGDL
jgi:hypothetical protein